MLAALQTRGTTVRSSLQILAVDDDDADALMISEALESSETHTVFERVADWRYARDYRRR